MIEEPAAYGSVAVYAPGNRTVSLPAFVPEPVTAMLAQLETG